MEEQKILSRYAGWGGLSEAFDEKNIDWNEVNKMYRFIVDRTSELEGKLQVIIVDHADLNNASFREYICENWWPIDKNLVPNDWYKKD